MNGKGIDLVFDWVCPCCGATDETRNILKPHSRLHPCPKTGVMTPMVRAGTKCKIVVRERDDYVNGEAVQFSSKGRPIMSIEVVRDNGQDLVVFAPMALGRVR